MASNRIPVTGRRIPTGDDEGREATRQSKKAYTTEKTSTPEEIFKMA